MASIPRVVALVGSNKIGTVSTLPFLAPEQISHFFTDSDVDPEFIEQMQQATINLTI